MTEDMYMMTVFFGSAIVIVLGLPLVIAYVRRHERKQVASPGETDRDLRLTRIESAIETMAVEVERISEGQRFVTKLLAEREATRGSLPHSMER